MPRKEVSSSYESETESSGSEASEFELLQDGRHKPAVAYIFAINLTDNLRQLFVFVLLIGNFIALNLVVSFMILGWYVSSSLSSQIIFLSGYYSAHAVPAMLALSGSTMIFVSLLGLKAATGGRYTDNRESAKSASLFFFAYWIGGLITIGIIFISAIACFSQNQLLTGALGQGLRDGMEKYTKIPKVKIALDYLQMSYQCCGESGYKDWYNISWADYKYLDISSDPSMPRMMKGLKYYGKDVPFSCCKKEITRPCIDTRIEDKSYNSKYRYPNDLTVSTIGCKEMVSKALANMMRGIGIFVLTCFSIWVKCAILS